MNRQAVLDVLNSLEVVDQIGGESPYILVANNEENRMKLNAVGVSDETIRKYGGDDEFVCILALAFHGGYADDYKDGKFVLKHELTEQQIIVTLATKVMGWQRKKDDYVDWWMHEDVFICRVDEWNPLQNIADAWMLVEKLRADGFGVNIFASGTGFNCEVYEFTSGTSLADIDASTAQEAISNAAREVVADDLLGMKWRRKARQRD